ncbi:MAG TPA: CcmD family protein [Ktedonobacterales bacterium]|jgi:CcmD family protein|nr:CcmD family protein [Ktedonobacterales bacterium]
MQGNTFLVLAYAIAWIGLLAYLGWIALRMRGVRAELETVRELVEQKEAGTRGS